MSTRPVAPYRSPNELLEARVGEHGDRLALVGGTPLVGEVSWDLRTVLARRDALARAMVGLGVERGTRVVWLLDNTLAAAAIVMYHAVERLGAVSVPINPRSAVAEVDKYVASAKATVLIGPERFHACISLVDGALATTIEELWSAAGHDSDAALPAERAAGELDHDQVILFTSGTTGRPKGIVLTAQAAVESGWGWGSVFGLTDADVYQSPFPVYAGAGLHFSWLGCLSRGAVCALESYETEQSLDRIERLGTTVYGAVPSIYAYWLRDGCLEHRSLDSLRLLDYGGAAMPVEHIRQLEEALPGVSLVQTYGLSEAGPGGTFLPPQHALSKAGSIGNHAFSPAMELSVRGPDGKSCRAGDVGEICLRGPSVMKGYLDPASSDDPIDADGWLHTGDAGRFDHEGFLYLVDRIKELVVRGGANISPAEIEDALLQVDGVLAAAVVGFPHPALGEDLAAFVVGDAPPSQDLLVAALKQRIADFKVPRRWIFVDELPLTDAGKIDKKLLRSRL